MPDFRVYFRTSLKRGQIHGSSGELRAVRVTARREFIRGAIENIKDQVS